MRRSTNWFVLGLTYFTLLVFGLADNVRGPVFPDLIADYHLTDAEGSFFFFVTSGFALLNSAFGSLWLQRLGAFRTLQIFSALQVVGLLVMGFAPSFAVLLGGCAILGVSTGGLGIAQNVLATEAVEPRWRRQSLSGLHTMYGISSLFAPLMVTTLYGWGVAWRHVFAWIAVGSLVAVVASLRGSGVFSGVLREVNEVKDAKDEVVRVEGVNLKNHPDTRRSLWAKIIYMGLILAFYVISEVAISSRLALYARREVGLDVTQANLLLSGFFLLLFIGRLGSAIVHFPLSNLALLRLSAVTSLVAFSLGLLHHPGWLALCGLTMSVFYPCMMAYLAERMGDRIGYATAWSVTIQLLGLMLMHFALGRIADVASLGAALWIGPICLAFVLVFLLPTRFNPSK